MEEMDSMFRAPEERTDFTSLVTEEAEVKPSKRYSEDDFQGGSQEGWRRKGGVEGGVEGWRGAWRGGGWRGG